MITRRKKGKYIHSIPIVGNRSDIPYMAKKYNIDEIIIAIPSASPMTIREILNICQGDRCKAQETSCDSFKPYFIA